MNAHTAIWEPVTYAEMSYVLTEEDVEDGKNRLGMDVSHIPLNVPLCMGCDKPIHNDCCPSCCVVFTDGEQIVEVERLSDGRLVA